MAFVNPCTASSPTVDHTEARISVTATFSELYWAAQSLKPMSAFSWPSLMFSLYCST